MSASAVAGCTHEASERELARAGAEREAFTNVNTPADWAAAARHPLVDRGDRARVTA